MGRKQTWVELVQVQPEEEGYYWVSSVGSLDTRLVYFLDGDWFWYRPADDCDELPIDVFFTHYMSVVPPNAPAFLRGKEARNFVAALRRNDAPTIEQLKEGCDG